MVAELDASFKKLHEQHAFVNGTFKRMAKDTRQSLQTKPKWKRGQSLRVWPTQETSEAEILHHYLNLKLLLSKICMQRGCMDRTAPRALLSEAGHARFPAHGPQDTSLENIYWPGTDDSHGQPSALTGNPSSKGDGPCFCKTGFIETWLALMYYTLAGKNVS